MTAWWTALAVLACAATLLVVERAVARAEASWVRAVAPRPVQELDDDHELDLTTLNAVPPAFMGHCPEPPFVALVYHHTCGSCRALWKQIGQTEDLDRLHMVHSADETETLRRRGLLREPVIALPADLMDSLPSGLLLRVEADWRFAEVHLATSMAEVRQVMHAAAARS